jgi:hypothetical protein
VATHPLTLLFPSFPFEPRRIDAGFEGEARVAQDQGFEIALVDLELLGNLGSEPTFNKLPDKPTTFLYRGWLLRPEIYRRMEECLKALGHRLMVTTDDYSYSYNFTSWYPDVEEFTPRSKVFTPTIGATEFNLDTVARSVAKEFGNKPVLVKDFLKSRKHEWFDACFIRPADDLEEVMRVTKNFLDGQGADFYGGLVYREFIEYERAGIHPKSRMPLINEWRIFVWKHQALYVAPYWPEGDPSKGPDLNNPTIQTAVKRIDSPFFVLDLARRAESDVWDVIEVNDAGAAGIPEGGSALSFYEALAMVCTT